MDIPIEVAQFDGRGLTVRTGSLFKGASVLIDGKVAPHKKSRYTVTDNSGRAIEVELKTRFLDPMPRLVIDGQMIELARPLVWYEYAWMGLPLLMVFLGGCLGAIGGIFAAHVNSHIFRSDMSAPARYALTGLVSFGMFGVFMIFAVIIQLAIGES